MASDETVSDDYLAALGLVTLRFNRLESAHLVLHKIVSKDAMAVTAKRFGKADGPFNLKMLEAMAVERGFGPKGMQLIKDFVRGYGICTQNRDLLTHSNVEPLNGLAKWVLEDGTVSGVKLSKSGQEVRYIFSEKTIRLVADQIEDLQSFGTAITGWLLTQLVGAEIDAPFPDTPLEPLMIKPTSPEAPQEPVLPPLPSTA